MSRDHLLALDVGSTRITALVLRCDGQVVARTRQDLPTRFPSPGRVEHDAGEMVERSLAALRDALATARVEASAVAALGIATQRASVVAWDARTGEPLAPVISWQDQRTGERVEELCALGLAITTLPSVTKLEWWMRNDDRVRACASRGDLRFGTPDSWLGWKLSGGQSHVTDPGQASATGLYDLQAGGWWDGAFELFEIPREPLAEVVPTVGIQGETPASLLGASIPIAARAGDQQAAAFAQGVHDPGAAKLTLGTSAMLDVHIGDVPDRKAPGAFQLALWRLGERDEFALEGSVITAGAAVDWLVGLGLLPAAEQLDRLVGSADANDEAWFVPALQGLGTPYLDTRAAGHLGGLRRGTGAPEIARAALEGIAQRCADVFEALVVGDVALRVDGGLARSDRLCARLADLIGARVLRATEPEMTALGAAQLAGLASGIFADRAACRAVLPPPEPFEPQLPAAERTALRERWKRLLPRVPDVD